MSLLGLEPRCQLCKQVSSFSTFTYMWLEQLRSNCTHHFQRSPAADHFQPRRLSKDHGRHVRATCLDRVDGPEAPEKACADGGSCGELFAGPGGAEMGWTSGALSDFQSGLRLASLCIRWLFAGALHELWNACKPSRCCPFTSFFFELRFTFRPTLLSAVCHQSLLTASHAVGMRRSLKQAHGG